MSSNRLSPDQMEDNSGCSSEEQAPQNNGPETSTDVSQRFHPKFLPIFNPLTKYRFLNHPPFPTNSYQGPTNPIGNISRSIDGQAVPAYTKQVRGNMKRSDDFQTPTNNLDCNTVPSTTNKARDDTECCDLQTTTNHLDCQPVPSTSIKERDNRELNDDIHTPKNSLDRQTVPSNINQASEDSKCPGMHTTTNNLDHHTIPSNHNQSGGNSKFTYNIQTTSNNLDPINDLHATEDFTEATDAEGKREHSDNPYSSQQNSDLSAPHQNEEAASRKNPYTTRQNGENQLVISSTKKTSQNKTPVQNISDVTTNTDIERAGNNFTTHKRSLYIPRLNRLIRVRHHPQNNGNSSNLSPYMASRSCGHNNLGNEEAIANNPPSTSQNNTWPPLTVSEDHSGLKFKWTSNLGNQNNSKPVGNYLKKKWKKCSAFGQETTNALHSTPQNEQHQRSNWKSIEENEQTQNPSNNGQGTSRSLWYPNVSYSAHKSKNHEGKTRYYQTPRPSANRSQQPSNNIQTRSHGTLNDHRSSVDNVEERGVKSLPGGLTLKFQRRSSKNPRQSQEPTKYLHILKRASPNLPNNTQKDKEFPPLAAWPPLGGKATEIIESQTPPHNCCQQQPAKPQKYSQAALKTPCSKSQEGQVGQQKNSQSNRDTPQTPHLRPQAPVMRCPTYSQVAKSEPWPKLGSQKQPTKHQGNGDGSSQNPQSRSRTQTQPMEMQTYSHVTKNTQQSSTSQFHTQFIYPNTNQPTTNSLRPPSHSQLHELQTASKAIQSIPQSENVNSKVPAKYSTNRRISNTDCNSPIKSPVTILPLIKRKPRLDEEIPNRAQIAGSEVQPDETPSTRQDAQCTDQPLRQAAQNTGKLTSQDTQCHSQPPNVSLQQHTGAIPKNKHHTAAQPPNATLQQHKGAIPKNKHHTAQPLSISSQQQKGAIPKNKHHNTVQPPSISSQQQKGAIPKSKHHTAQPSNINSQQQKGAIPKNKNHNTVQPPSISSQQQKGAIPKSKHHTAQPSNINSQQQKGAIPKNKNHTAHTRGSSTTSQVPSTDSLPSNGGSQGQRNELPTPPQNHRRPLLRSRRSVRTQRNERDEHRRNESVLTGVICNDCGFVVPM